MAKVIHIYDKNESPVMERLRELSVKNAERVLENYNRKMKESLNKKRACSKQALINTFSN